MNFRTSLAERPELPLLVTANGIITRGQAFTTADRYARHLTALGLDQGDYFLVENLARPQLELFRLACVLIGVKPKFVHVTPSGFDPYVNEPITYKCTLHADEVAAFDSLPAPDTGYADPIIDFVFQHQPETPAKDSREYVFTWSWMQKRALYNPYGFQPGDCHLYLATDGSTAVTPYYAEELLDAVIHQASYAVFDPMDAATAITTIRSLTMPTRITLDWGPKLSTEMVWPTQFATDLFANATQDDLKNVVMITTGEPITTELAATVDAKLPAGVSLVHHYGSWAMANTLFTTPDMPADKRMTFGKYTPNGTYKIIDGKLNVRGDLLCPLYGDAPHSDDWINTGLTATVDDDGYIATIG